jgi:aminoglycoside phosphotransferase (APT) family kinase protein
MAPLGDRDLERAREALTGWIARQLPGSTGVAITELEQPTTGGYSNELLFFTAAWTGGRGDRVTRELVARITSPVPALFPNPSMDREFALLKALNRTKLPVPEMLWLENDPAVLGAPFVTMERVRGRTPADNPPYTAEGWVLELTPDQQATLYDNGLRTVAAVAGVDIEALDLDAFLDGRGPEAGETPSEERVAFAERYLAWASEGREFPLLQNALAWVKEHCPAVPEPLALTWGDGRVGNMMFDDDLEVVAALDWEQAALSSRELDLGWWLFSRRTHGEGLGIELPPGFLTREQTIARYEQLTGEPVRHIDFYEILNGLIGAIAVMRIGDTMIRAGALPADSPMPSVNPASVALAGLLGLPVPTGEVTSWVTSS